MLSTVEPFGNNLTTLNLTGAQIQSLLEEQWNAANRSAKTNPATGGAGRLLAISKGLTYSFDNSKIAGNFATAGSPIVAGTLKLNGVVIDPAKSYKIVTNSFMIGAVADNFTVMAKGSNITDTKMLDLDALIAYFRANSPVSPPAARVTRLN
jgi:5'-nucleotidase